MLSEKDYQLAANLLSCEIAAVKAVVEVESRGSGFQVDGKPIILFEPYQFADHTKNRFAGKTVTIHGVIYPLSINRRERVWTVKNAKYGPSSIQHLKLDAAKALDETAAYKSCSWGLFQILGSNYRMCGYSSVQNFVAAMCKSEFEQLQAFCHFVINAKLATALINHDWVEFAVHYNGPKQDKGTADETDDYDYFLQKAYEKLKAQQ